MCIDPVSMGMIGAGLSAVSTMAGGFMQYQMGQYQQKLANANADRVQATANANELMQVDKDKRTIASQAVALSGQGTRIDTGTPLLLLGESARNARLDEISIVNEGVQQGEAYRAQGKAAARQGLYSAIAAPFTAAGNLLSSKGGQDLISSLGSI